MRCYSVCGSDMESPIQRNLDEIIRLCRRHEVRRLAVFGSAVRADFDPQRSDIDFLVEFEPIPVADRMRNFSALRDGLAKALRHKVDLVEDGAIRNPYVLKSVFEQQQTLYAA